LDRRAHEQKVSCFSDYLLFFLAVASNNVHYTYPSFDILIAAVPRDLIMFWHDFGQEGRGAIVTVLSRTHRCTTVGKTACCC
jgi:hypothetical protein